MLDSNKEETEPIPPSPINDPVAVTVKFIIFIYKKGAIKLNDKSNRHNYYAVRNIVFYL
jgi:hypothetical protein